MKNLKNISIAIYSLLILSFIGLSSCSEDDSTSNGAPVITEVNATLIDGVPSDLTPLTQGFANQMYVIKGSGFASVQKIYFNDMDTYFNPALVTDNAIFVTINKDTPYFETIDELKVVTERGTAIFEFKVLPAAPIIKSYNSINAQAGDIVTIYGSYFLDPVVTIGTTQANVISSNVSEIQFELPADANLKYLTVTTLSGTATAPQTIGSAFYDDEFHTLNTGSSALWNGNDSWDYNFTEDAFQGLKSIKLVLGGWNGIDIRRAGGVDLTPYKALRISVKGEAEGTLKYLINDNWAITPNLPITTGWVTLEIPFSDLGNPATFTGITFQESGNFGGNTILVDDIGFVLND